jgi:hypothetical protein
MIPFKARLSGMGVRVMELPLLMFEGRHFIRSAATNIQQLILDPVMRTDTGNDIFVPLRVLP